MENADIAATVLGISINAISDNYRDYYEELLKAADNSALADISDDEISSTFVLQLMTSVSHTVLVRMGIDPAAIFHGDEYESIRLFNSPDTIVQLGTATSDISEMILRQIERSVRSMERQERGTLAHVEPVLQNEGRNSERSDENGTRLQAERGLPDSRYQNGRSADGDDRQIRQNAEDVSQGASERDLQLPAASEQADGASVGDRQDGAGTGRTDDGADGADRERDREDESRESDALDSANEQHSAESRGDGTERPDLRITEYSLFPTLEEQLQRIEEAEAQKLTAFSVSQADIDHELCRHGSGFANGKLRIYKFFEDMPSSDAAITFLKKEYGIGGHSHTYLNGESGFVDHDGKGIHFSNYNYKEKHTITWKAVARRLRELIAIDRYLTEKENYLSQKYTLEDSLLKHYPREIRLTQERIKGYEADIALYEQHRSEDFPGMLLCGTHYAEKKDAGAAILEACKAMTSPEAKEIGTYRGFTLLLSYDVLSKVFRMTLRGELSHTVELGSDIYGNIQRMENMFEAFPVRFSACEKALVTLKEQIGIGLFQLQYPQSCNTSFRFKQAVRIFYIQFVFQNIGLGIAICRIVLIIIKVIRQNNTYFTVYLFTSSLIAIDDDFCPLAHSRIRVSSLLLSRIPSIAIVPAICFVIFSLLTIVSHLAFLILLYHIHQQSKPIIMDRRAFSALLRVFC